MSDFIQCNTFAQSAFQNACVPAPTVLYQGDGKKRRRRRRWRTQELFDQIEASVRARIAGLGEAAEVAHGRFALAPNVLESPAMAADLARLRVLASDYADLSARVDRLEHNLDMARARAFEREEEDIFLLMS